jgi:hypothetical protein
MYGAPDGLVFAASELRHLAYRQKPLAPRFALPKAVAVCVEAASASARCSLRGAAGWFCSTRAVNAGSEGQSELSRVGALECHTR